ncbi:GNAT family N-acetyltransferase [Brachybacterium sp. JHP9]|uniref:GNAT family N-acetyltransferase n=1 Tax=Brachybacterium equifaecis TaxID=2910770 RepID=A0ABT0QYF0_9MICO|nr:GNAT family N-acetyltransferase [Brachybacterium equifaecis]
MTANLTLRPLRLEDEAEVRRLQEQLLADDFDFLLDDGQPFAAYLEGQRREACGEDLAPGRVPAEFLVAEVDGEIVGRVSIRHELNDFLRTIGGHVGYAVGPEHRRRGYATEILRQSVARLAELGVERVLVTCDDTNAASAATIERCGGVLEDLYEPGGGKVGKRRYWIDARRGR